MGNGHRYAPPGSMVANFPGVGAVRFIVRLGGWIAPRWTVIKLAQRYATPFSASRKRALSTSQNTDATSQNLPLGPASSSLRVYTWGNPQTQPYVLLVHGWSSHGLRFDGWARRLHGMGYAVVAFDHPAHGLSEGRLATLPDLALAVEGVGRHFGTAAAVLAHSFGCAAVVHALQRWRAEKVVLIAPAADLVAAAMRFTRGVALRDTLAPGFLKWHEHQTGVHPATLAVHPLLPSFTQPALIIHDLEDPEVPWEEGERYARYWPGARLLTTQGLGHSAIVDAPAVVAAAISFLDGDEICSTAVSSSNLLYGMS